MSPAARQLRFLLPVLAASMLVMTSSARAADVTFGGLMEGPIAGQGDWLDYDGGTSVLAVTSFTPAHLGSETKVLASGAANDFATLIMPEPFGLGPAIDGHSHVVQADVCPGSAAIIEISVGHDLDIKPEKGGGDGRRGPGFGFSGGKFILRSANPNTMVAADRGPNDDLTDWYSMRMIIDFKGHDGQGAGELQVRNLTDGEVNYRTVLLDINLQFKVRMAAASRDPALWNAWFVRAHGKGAMVDNLAILPPVAE